MLPCLRMVRATAGAALAGSAMPSVGEKTPPFQARPVASRQRAAVVVLFGEDLLQYREYPPGQLAHSCSLRAGVERAASDRICAPADLADEFIN